MFETETRIAQVRQLSRSLQAANAMETAKMSERSHFGC